MGLREKIEIASKSEEVFPSTFLPKINFEEINFEKIGFDSLSCEPPYLLRYEARLAVSVCFDCHPSNLPRAKERARNQLLHFLYEDINHLILGALNAANSGDQKETERLLEKALSQISPRFDHSPYRMD